MSDGFLFCLFWVVRSGQGDAVRVGAVHMATWCILFAIRVLQISGKTHDTGRGVLKAERKQHNTVDYQS